MKSTVATCGVAVLLLLLLLLADAAFGEPAMADLDGDSTPAAKTIPYQKKMIPARIVDDLGVHHQDSRFRATAGSSDGLSDGQADTTMPPWMFHYGAFQDHHYGDVYGMPLHPQYYTSAPPAFNYYPGAWWGGSPFPMGNLGGNHIPGTMRPLYPQRRAPIRPGSSAVYSRPVGSPEFNRAPYSTNSPPLYPHPGRVPPNWLPPTPSGGRTFYDDATIPPEYLNESS